MLCLWSLRVELPQLEVSLIPLEGTGATSIKAGRTITISSSRLSGRRALGSGGRGSTSNRHGSATTVHS